MKINLMKVVGLLVIGTVVTAVAGKSKYSGIYELSTGDRVILAITKGGHLLSLSNDTSIADELDPSKSTVSATGKVVGSTQKGLTVAAQISSDFKVTGTGKQGKRTFRITGSRTLN